MGGNQVDAAGTLESILLSLCRLAAGLPHNLRMFVGLPASLQENPRADKAVRCRKEDVIIGCLYPGCHKHGHALVWHGQ